VLLRLLDNLAERAGAVGQILLRIFRAILGMAWSIVTIFVVPVLVFENVGPFAAIKKSVKVLRKTWGESLIRYFGLGLIQGMFVLLAIFVGIVLAFVLGTVAGLVGLVIGAGIGLAALVLVILVFNVAHHIFNTALYMYADSGKVPEGYDSATLKNAFRSRTKKGILGGIAR
ncbi:DUF6159 family protein, partial [Nanoarchaeota archaeon]